ncbi:DUF5134 domain-containing protein [Streptomyces sp. NPDC057638]|uniref:DUF5134 domain-containing protein n=1 Tax=Streptomyces sp. NPDC057638 TaxID=3346190 RepID=UPI0036809B13
MHGSTLPGWLLVTLCATTGVHCLVRMRGHRGGPRREAGGEALMAFAMAAMAVPASALAPPRWSWLVYAVVFGATALTALLPLGQDPGHRLHHLVGSLAMVYMAVAMSGPAPGGHAGHAVSAPAGVPAVTAALLLYYGVYILRSGVRLLPVSPPGRTVAADRPYLSDLPVPAPADGGHGGMATACQVAMGIAMLAMLATL